LHHDHSIITIDINNY